MSKILSGGVAVDDRGSLRFINDFNPAEAGVKRFYQVENHDKGFIRAWHGHAKEKKYVYVVRGSAIVACTKMEKVEDVWGLTTEVERFVLSDKAPRILEIPAGYANGFQTLEEGTIIIFFSTTTLEESQGDDFRFPFDEINIWGAEFR